MATQPSAILPHAGRVAIADAISRRPLHMAWGLGDGAWLDPIPSPAINVTALMNEVGRRTITDWKFVVSDPTGSIEVDTGRFSLSPGNAPTNNLYVTCRFDFTDAPGAVIREIALFTNTDVAGGLPPGQAYFLPAQVTAQGMLIYVQNITPIFRSPAIQENFEAVITF